MKTLVLLRVTPASTVCLSRSMSEAAQSTHEGKKPMSPSVCWDSVEGQAQQPQMGTAASHPFSLLRE